MDDLSTLLDQLGGTSGGTADPAAALTGLSQAVQDEGGLDGLIGKLKAAGLGDEVDSWISTGANQAVDPARLGEALGPDTVQRLSAGSGLDIGSLLPMLAAFLPQIINMLTPDGKMPEAGSNSSMPDLGGMLGGLLGGAGGSTTGAATGGTAGAGGLDDLLGGLGGMLGGKGS